MKERDFEGKQLLATAQTYCVRVARSYAPQEETDVHTENIGFNSYIQTHFGWVGGSGMG